MSRFWNLICGLHSLAGPVTMLLYPLYASVIAIESPSKVDDQQWLAYWILYSFLTLTEMVLQPVLEWIPIWYTVKLVFTAWLVLPWFRGAAFIYERFVREKIRQYRGAGVGVGVGVGVTEHHHKSPTGGKARNKFVDFIIPKKGEHEAS
ncbi:HVA22-like protein [Melia azedarach]|uniref:HVA22-like protein n=1 Tax=Melia azedarach TaxID=155640 RepID=A0ACC1YZC1_MELAZ|nr:HVA22-like protein [Melia azedarach]